MRDNNFYVFISVYGWVILAFVIAIGVIVYFGFFSPDKYVSESYSYKCLAEKLCEEYDLKYLYSNIGINNWVKCFNEFDKKDRLILLFNVNVTDIKNRYGEFCIK